MPEPLDPLKASLEAKLQAKLEADRQAAAVVATSESPTGLRGPTWAWYGAGFVALGFGFASLLWMRPPLLGLEPELVASPGPGAPLAKDQPPPASLRLSASLWRGALEVRASRLPTDTFTAVALIDATGQPWRVQLGERQDPSCLPSCGELKLRVELDQLPPGPFRTLVLASPKPIGEANLDRWLPHAQEGPPLGLGVRAYAMKRVER